MEYFFIEPEVAGNLGPHTSMNKSTYPPVVTKLHYEFEGWLGDVLLESFPVFIATESVNLEFKKSAMSGANFDSAEITLSPQFRELYPSLELPAFLWLKPIGHAGIDDIGLGQDGRLVVSRRLLDILERLGFSNALVNPFE